MHEFPPLFDCWFLTGATASGKTRVGMELAQRLDAEIISLDSMAVYRDMDIGTAKPTPRQQATIPHHLLDLVNPNQVYSLSDYITAAHRAVDEIKQRGHRVLFVGGTPLYLKSLLRGVCEGPPGDAEFRQEVAQEIQRVGMAALRARLEQVDPLSAAKLHPNDRRRTIRALEVYKLTGTPISHYQVQFDEPRGRCRSVFVLSWNRATLHERINARVDEMFRQGFVDEVRGLLEKYGELSTTALQGVGYRQIIAQLHGAGDLAAAITETKTRTRRFARRQETWFRGLEECQWISLDQDLAETEVVDRILGHAPTE